MVKGKSAELEAQSKEDELISLRAKVADMEAAREAEQKQHLEAGSYTAELENLRKNVGKGGLNEIKYKEIVPPMVSLYHVSGHNVGKRVGPLMAELAEETFLRFRFFKIKLSSTKPTEKWIEEYKKTDEYKKAEAAEIKRRAGKNKSRKESEVEKLTAAIAKMQGVDAKTLNSIIPQEEVKGLKA